MPIENATTSSGGTVPAIFKSYEHDLLIGSRTGVWVVLAKTPANDMLAYNVYERLENAVTGAMQEYGHRMPDGGEWAWQFSGTEVWCSPSDGWSVRIFKRSIM